MERQERDFDWFDNLWAVIKENGSFAGVPCKSLEEARELANQYEGSHVYNLCINYDDDCGFDPYMGCFTDDC